MGNDLVQFNPYQTIDLSNCLEVTNYQIDHIEGNLIIIKDTMGYRIASMETKTGKANLLSKILYQNNIYFEDDMAIVLVNNSVGVIDKQGKFIIKPRYEDIKYNVHNKTFSVKKREYGLIDKTGKILIDSENSIIIREIHFVGNHAVITAIDEDGAIKQGLINSDGKITIKPKYIRLFIIDDQRLIYQKSKKKWIIMDYQEKQIAETKYRDNIIEFHGKIAIVSERSDKDHQYLMDLEGNEIDYSAYANTTWEFEYDTFSVRIPCFGNNAIIDKEGNLVDRYIRNCKIYDDGTYLYNSYSFSYSGIYNALKGYNAHTEYKKPTSYVDYSNGFVVINQDHIRYIVNHELQRINDRNYMGDVEIDCKGNLIKVKLSDYNYEIIDINGEVIVPDFQAETVFLYDDEHIIVDNHLVDLTNLKYQYNLDLESEQNTNTLVFDSKDKRELYLDCAKEELNKLLSNQEEKIEQVKKETNEKIMKLILNNN